MKPTTSDSTGQAGTRPVIREITRPDPRLAFPAMQALRADYADEAAFVQRVDEVQRPEGYRLVGVFVEPDDHALSVAGFRVAIAWPGPLPLRR